MAVYRSFSDLFGNTISFDAHPKVVHVAILGAPQELAALLDNDANLLCCRVLVQPRVGGSGGRGPAHSQSVTFGCVVFQAGVTGTGTRTHDISVQPQVNFPSLKKNIVY